MGMSTAQISNSDIITYIANRAAGVYRVADGEEAVDVAREYLNGFIEDGYDVNVDQVLNDAAAALRGAAAELLAEDHFANMEDDR